MIRVYFALVATVLWAGAAFAQHTSAGSGSSSGSSGGSSGGSYSGSSGGGSHGGYSGGSGSSGGSSGGHSSGGYSGGGHSSGGSGSHGSGSGSSVGSGSRGHGSSGHFSSGSSPASRYIPSKQPQNPHVIREWPGGLQPKNPQPEKRSFLSFLRHPFRKTPPVSELRHRICVQGTCTVCPAGQSATRNGGCVSNTGQNLNGRNMCVGGSYWNGEGCAVLGAQTRCRSIYLSHSLSAAAREMDEAKKNKDFSCSLDPAGQECSRLTEEYQRKVELYDRLQVRQIGAFNLCATGSPFASLDAID